MARHTKRPRPSARLRSCRALSPSGEFEVLYTSLERDGALAEIGYRLSLEPVWPSRVEHELHAIEAATERTLRFPDLGSLPALGAETARFESFDYAATQKIAAAARFLEYDGLIVPSARFPCSNLVIFTDRLGANVRLVLRKSKRVDWSAWRRSRARG